MWVYYVNKDYVNCIILLIEYFSILYFVVCGRIVIYILVKCWSYVYSVYEGIKFAMDISLGLAWSKIIIIKMKKKEREVWVSLFL